MRELHVVATSEDGRHVVLATSKKASTGDFRVALDDRLEAAVRGDLPRPGETEPAVVTPKEIQARLRAGESPEQIAASAGVPVSKIDRYAGPVLSERERVISQARAGTVSRSRLGESALPLGEAVDRHLSLTTGVRMETVQWSARREEAGSWLVELSYVSQARRRTATWRYDVSRREVTAVDSASAALAHVEPGRRSRTAEPDAHSAPPARASSRGSSRTSSRRAAPVRERKAAAPSARTVAARPTPPVRVAAPVPKAPAPAKAAQTAATRSAAARAAGATTARAAAQERAAKAAAAEAARAAAAAKKAADAQAKADKARAAKRAADEAAQARAAAKKADKAAQDKAAREKAAAQAEAEAAAQAEAEAARVAESAPTGPPTLRVVGSDDNAEPARRGAKQPPAAARTAPARAAGQRASVPGWADVLLSTAPVARPVDPEPEAD